MDFGGSPCTMNLGNKIGKRSSTRVAAPPGGASSVIIGGPEEARPARPVERPPVSNPINWGQLEAAPRSSPAVARAGAADRLNNSIFAAAPTAISAAPEPAPAAPCARPTTPYATSDDVENVPPGRTGRKLGGGYAQDTGGMLAWNPSTIAAEKAAEVAEVAGRCDRVTGGGRSSISLGTTAAPVAQISGRAPPGGYSSFNLMHQ